MTLAVAPLPVTPANALRCDLCAIAEGRGVKILRLALVQANRAPGPTSTARRRTSRGAGTILLCERCWRNTGGKRLRQRGKLAPSEP